MRTIAVVAGTEAFTQARRDIDALFAYHREQDPEDPLGPLVAVVMVEPRALQAVWKRLGEALHEHVSVRVTDSAAVSGVWALHRFTPLDEGWAAELAERLAPDASSGLVEVHPTDGDQRVAEEVEALATALQRRGIERGAPLTWDPRTESVPGTSSSSPAPR